MHHLKWWLYVLIAFRCLTPDLLAQSMNERSFIDLEGHDFTEHKEISLDGPWKFYWNELLYPDTIDSSEATQIVSFPHLWNDDPSLSSFGYATYITTIALPPNTPDLSVIVPDMYSAYTLYINGKVIAQNGKVATHPEDYKPYWVHVNASLNSFKSDTLQLVLQIANFDHSKGGIRLPIILGEKDHLMYRSVLEFGLILLLTGCILMIGLVFLGLYLFGRHEFTMLCFAVFCFFFSYQVIGTDFYALHLLIPDIPWLLTIKVEYFSLFATGFSFSIFVLKLYPYEVSKKILYLFAGIYALFALITLIFPPYYFTQLVDYFLVVLPLYALFITWVYIKAVLNNREGSRFALGSTIFVFIVIIYNTLVYSTILEESLLFYYSGLFCFFFLQSLILTYRYTNSLTRAREKAEESAKVKSQFLSTMSHEIRTPLNAIIGVSELMMHSDSVDERKKYVNLINESGKNLLELINKILDYSKFETSGIETDLKPVNLRAIIEDILNLLGPLYEEKNINFEVDIYSNVPEWIMSDSTHLKQVLINLVGNAIKFTNEGTIIIRIQPHSDLQRKGNFKFTIIDSGKGIAELETDRLFKTFSQLDPSSTREHGGTGLGLVISQKLVDALDGEIWHENNSRQGATFHFTITAEKTTSTALVNHHPKSNSKSSVEQSQKQLRVMVAEDNLINQKVIQKILESHQLYPDMVKDGQEAFDKIMEKDYDLIFMDMEMPVMDGIEACQKIRATLPDKKQPIIVAITANAFLEDREKCLNAGMNDFLSKPISMKDIAGIMEKWF